MTSEINGVDRRQSFQRVVALSSLLEAEKMRARFILLA